MRIVQIRAGKQGMKAAIEQCVPAYVSRHVGAAFAVAILGAVPVGIPGIDGHHCIRSSHVVTMDAPNSCSDHRLRAGVPSLREVPDSHADRRHQNRKFAIQRMPLLHVTPQRHTYEASGRRRARYTGGDSLSSGLDERLTGRFRSVAPIAVSSILAVNTTLRPWNGR
jgi:hypothetical protein